MTLTLKDKVGFQDVFHSSTKLTAVVSLPSCQQQAKKALPQMESN